jgi:hypothetical protein
MKLELIIIGITIFFILNTYSDGKYVKIVKSWKKYYQMAGIGFIGLSAYIFMKKYPSHSQNLLCHANGLLKYMPIDKEASDLLTPFLDMSKGAFTAGTGLSMMSPQERRVISSGNLGNISNNMGGNNIGVNNSNNNVGNKATKRSVSETKKKYVASQQGWNCGGCKRQLPAWFEVDHKIRLENGGSNNVDNLVALCRDCHGKKTAFENL